MSEVTLNGLLKRGCLSCGGDMELVQPRALAPFRRCVSCGRDNRTSAPELAKPEIPPLRHLGTVGKPCPVEGCPGVVLLGVCDCCEKRKAFAASLLPARECGICTGRITGKYGRKFCDACAPIAKRQSVANSKKKTRGHQ